MVPAYPRATMMAAVCAALEAGATLRQIAARPGWPSRQTVHRWAVEDPTFAARLSEARNLRRGVRTQARGGFDPELAEAFLLRVRRGETVRRLVRTPGMPNRDRLDRWKAERPEFAAALAQAARFSREVKDSPWARYDPVAADAVIVRVNAGETMACVCADPDLPGETALRRWRAREPDFAKALRAAQRAGHRARMATRVKLTPELSEEILLRMAHGASLRQVAMAPGMPHYTTLMAWQRRDEGFAWLLEMGRREGAVSSWEGS